MNSQDLNGIYPIVLPKPNEEFEQKYYEILDNGLYNLDTETSDATELIDNSMLPVSVEEIPKVGINQRATEWAKEIYTNLLSEKRCVYDDEFQEIVNRLPDFYALKGSKQKMKDYLMKINLTTFLDLIKGMPIYRLNILNPAIPQYNLKGKGYHPENTSDWINFNNKVLLECTYSLSEESKSILNKKYLRPNEGSPLIQAIRDDVDKLRIKQDGNNPNEHLIIKYDIENRSYLSDDFKVHVLENFIDWLVFWSSKGYPIGLNTRFLIDR